jgi:hypothetical protein
VIPLVEEPKEHFREFRVYEKCYFNCGNSTKYWHWRTNQPICKDCAKKHKVSEVKKSHPSFKVKNKKEYTKNS